MITDHCQQRCTCMNTGEVECVDFSCNAAEECQVKKGVMGCQPKECLIEAGASLTLFTGTSGIVSIMGAYEIIAHCDESSADWFRIVAKFQECSVTGVKSVVAVYVYFSEMMVTITDKQDAWVSTFKGIVKTCLFF